MLSHHDRRQHRRRRANWSVIVQLKSGKGFKSHTIDVSESGVSIASAYKLDRGERITLQLTAVVQGKQTKIRCIAECRFVSLSNNIYQCGLRLLGLSEEGKQQIREYVEGGHKPEETDFYLSPSDVKHASSQIT
tara:strand:+ start:13747 stop:14148 length:402 start_codon:yes stop_codon:yes gene_type:complete